MNYTSLRNAMVDEQLIPRGISNSRVLEAFRAVKRHEFVDPELYDNAYEDHPLPIGEGQTISQPYMVAVMTECLELKGDEKVLEIGTGSGYQAAILSKLAKEVYTVERIPSLAKKAETRFQGLGYKNIKVTVSDGTLGWKEHAPYNGIIVTAASPKIPSSYIEQLALGGRLVIPVGTMLSQVLTVIQKTSSGIKTQNMGGCVFVPLVGKNGWKE